MGFAYKITNQHNTHFITCTVYQWVDVFSRKAYADIFLDSIRYCQQAKGLKVYGWVIMTNHVHLIIGSDEQCLSDVIRDFKKYTATQIVKSIASNERESRKHWLLWLLRKGESICFWEEGYHGEEIWSQGFLESKLDYIHLTPVRAGIVEKSEEYLYSSSCDYYGNRKGLLEISDL